MEIKPRNAVIEEMNLRLLDIIIILVFHPSNQIEITTHHYWVLAPSNFTLQLIHERQRSGMICWPIDTNELKFELGSTMVDKGANEELTPINITISNILSLNPRSMPPECPEAANQL
jgi:hypothetical protein